MLVKSQDESSGVEKIIVQQDDGTKLEVEGAEGSVYLPLGYQGRLEAQGAPLKIITPGLIKKIYGLDCQIIPDPVSRTPLVIPEGRHHKTIQA